MACVPDLDGAMKEVEQAYELIKSHQPCLQLWDEQQPSAAINLTQSLLNEAMRALHIALSVMSSESSANVGGESSSRSDRPHLFLPSSAGSDVEGITNRQREAKRQRSNEVNSRVILTDAHHEDGYAWRKFGDKKINGTQFTRNYFRCSYKYDRGCQATKQIQQQSSNDMPMFQVTYNSDHTCKSTHATANKCSESDLPQLSYYSTDGMISPTDHAMIKKEQEQLLPPLVEASTVFTDSESLFCKEPFPLSHPYTPCLYCAGNCMTTSDDGSPDFPYGSTEEYKDWGQMVLPEQRFEVEPFSVAELDLLYSSIIQNQEYRYT